MIEQPLGDTSENGDAATVNKSQGEPSSRREHSKLKEVPESAKAAKGYRSNEFTY